MSPLLKKTRMLTVSDVKEAVQRKRNTSGTNSLDFLQQKDNEYLCWSICSLFIEQVSHMPTYFGTLQTGIGDSSFIWCPLSASGFLLSFVGSFSSISETELHTYFLHQVLQLTTIFQGSSHFTLLLGTSLGKDKMSQNHWARFCCGPHNNKKSI